MLIAGERFRFSRISSDVPAQGTSTNTVVSAQPPRDGDRFIGLAKSEERLFLEKRPSPRSSGMEVRNDRATRWAAR
jgi:hypothetical protein